MTTYPQHITEKANRLLANKSVMTFDQICEMLMKSEEKQNKKFGSKKEAAKFNQRQLVEATAPAANVHSWLAEKNRENAMKNLPSSLR